MTQTINLFIGAVVLLLGIPLGNYLAKFTKEELKAGQRWFKLVVVLGLIGAVVSLILRNDILLFTFLFITIVTSRSLKKKKRRKK